MDFTPFAKPGKPPTRPDSQAGGPGLTPQPAEQGRTKPATPRDQPLDSIQQSITGLEELKGRIIEQLLSQERLDQNGRNLF